MWGGAPQRVQPLKELGEVGSPPLHLRVAAAIAAIATAAATAHGAAHGVSPRAQPERCGRVPCVQLRHAGR
jgi:hypothetical protein